uniref:X-box-binding protein 1 n=1 Tax=Daphnia galeata TaxID=27404 RepID=A0A8J2R9V0_9CRUS|nr:unnamed protein product [Daphnia galeata]
MQIILIQPGSQAALSLAQTHQFVSSSSSTNGEGSEIDCDLSSEEKPTRKRQRLDHMTEQEKFLRRKMKNRVAAQTARDKKKAKMDELEEIVINLREENNRLKAENQHLLAENARLSGIPTPHVGEVSKSIERMYPVNFEDASTSDADSAISCSSVKIERTENVCRARQRTQPIPIRSAVKKYANIKASTVVNKNKIEAPTITKKEAAEEKIDILNWLTKAVLESDETENVSFLTKTENVDFDLLEYVETSCDDITLDEKIIDSLMSFETQTIVDFSTAEHEHVKSFPEIRDFNDDLLERAVECPASPYCKSEEIIEYIDNTNSISGSPICEENMQEPDWLSTWDNVA